LHEAALMAENLAPVEDLRDPLPVARRSDDRIEFALARRRQMNYHPLCGAPGESCAR
jgi:hypothetical protein